jgi:hypothetical protein
MLKLSSGRLRRFAAKYGSVPISLQRVDELVGAKLIRFETVIGGRFVGVSVVPEICATRTLLLRTDTIAPVVAIGEAPPG